MFRKILFWMHLVVGCTAGAVVLMMSVTGVLLMYEKQMIAWSDRAVSAAPPTVGASNLPLETLLEGKSPTVVTIQSRPSAAVSVTTGSGIVYLNAYTGQTAGEGTTGMRQFFRKVTDWHRWLGTDLPARASGKAVTGASNLLFLFLVISGAYLWLPRVWSWKNVRAIGWFRGGLSGRARDFNWHNAIGVWCVVPLFFVVLSGVVISYPWATQMVYRVTGTEPPPPGAAGAKGGGTKGGGAKGGGPREGGARPGGREESAAAPVNVAGLNAAWAVAEQQSPGWRTITLRMPPSERGPFSFTIDHGTAGQPQKRGTLTVNRQTAAVERWETFASLDAGRRLRSWLRFVHTGEYYGLLGQTIAGIASLGGAFLVWTGIALALRRFNAWRKRTTVPARQEKAA